METVKEISVIGAGAMGSGIAALFANAGYKVNLFARDQKKAETVVDKIFLGENPILTTKGKHNITICDIVDMDKVRNSDLIIEAIAENLEEKKKLFELANQHRKEGSLVASTTSTLLLKDLSKGMTDEDKKSLIVAHFFNPPTKKKLVEVVTNDNADPAPIDAMRDTLKGLGKEIIDCKDTPGFIANRISIYARMKGLMLSVEHGVPIHEVDEVTKFITGGGFGPFALSDFIGMKRVGHILTHFKKCLSEKDAFQVVMFPQELEKVRSGINPDGTPLKFYNKDRTQTIDPATLQYSTFDNSHLAPLQQAQLGELFNIIGNDSAVGKFAKAWIKDVLGYIDQVSAEIAKKPEDVDKAMTLGYNWKNPASKIKAALSESVKPNPNILTDSRKLQFTKKAGDESHRDYGFLLTLLLIRDAIGKGSDEREGREDLLTRIFEAREKAKYGATQYADNTLGYAHLLAENYGVKIDKTGRKVVFDWASEGFIQSNPETSIWNFADDASGRCVANPGELRGNKWLLFSGAGAITIKGERFDHKTEAGAVNFSRDFYASNAVQMSKAFGGSVTNIAGYSYEMLKNPKEVWAILIQSLIDPKFIHPISQRAAEKVFGQIFLENSENRPQNAILKRDEDGKIIGARRKIEEVIGDMGRVVRVGYSLGCLINIQVSLATENLMRELGYNKQEIKMFHDNQPLLNLNSSMFPPKGSSINCINIVNINDEHTFTSPELARFLPTDTSFILRDKSQLLCFFEKGGSVYHSPKGELEIDQSLYGKASSNYQGHGIRLSLDHAKESGVATLLEKFLKGGEHFPSMLESFCLCNDVKIAGAKNQSRAFAK